MYVFSLAIFIGLVIRYVSATIVNRYVTSKESDEALTDKTGFQVVVITYLLNEILLKINVAILIALLVKEYILT
jgi:hypothetical protein